MVVDSPPDEIETRLQKSPAGQEFLVRFRAYLDRTGFQISNLDFMEPTLGESPGPLLARIQHFLTQEEGSIPRIERSRQERLATEAQLKASLGVFRRPLLSWLLNLLDYGQLLREDVLFFLGLGWPVVRRFILELGHRMVRDGFLVEESDVFFTTQAEIEVFAAAPPKIDAADLKRNVGLRRERWTEQLRIKPPVLIPRDFSFAGIRLSRYMPEHPRAGAGNQMRGVPVSPGRATAPACVIGSPAEFQAMKAGGILVAPMTSPAWTPLLAMAGGVVTDVGGVLSHTSIVAREYGIPAVIGTGNATHRIATGQIVTVDGDLGFVTIDEPATESRTRHVSSETMQAQ
jgi:pyruvate,water dikinase